MKLYQEVTNRIITELEAGTPPWVKPWKDAKVSGLGMIPSNLATGRMYSGGNILLLWMTAQANGWPNLQFCTYSQASAMGARVRKGEKASYVIFTKHVMPGEDDEDKKARTIAKSYAVFSVAQLDGVPADKLEPMAAAEPEEVHQHARDLIRGTGIPVEHGGNRACYIPSQDRIQMPAPSQFKDWEAYMGTLAHEFVHGTGHHSRLQRKFGKRFGDPEYKMEELVAELGSAFLCARLGVQPNKHNASYLDHWLKAMKEEPRFIFTAASHAGQASDWLWEKAFHTEEPKPEEPAKAPEEEYAAAY